MAAGIRFYNTKGALMIDGSYSNIALTDKRSKTLAEKYATIQGRGVHIYFWELPYREPIIVVPLTDTITSIYSAGWMPNTNKFNLFLATNREDGVDFMVFDKASKKSTSGAALRIYSDITGEKVFDSRLKYLKVIGVATEGMVVPAGAKWGILVRERQLTTQVVFPSPNSPQIFVFSWFIGWKILDGKIKTERIMIREDYYSSAQTAGDIPLTDPPRNSPPLIVDLKNY